MVSQHNHAENWVIPPADLVIPLVHLECFWACIQQKCAHVFAEGHICKHLQSYSSQQLNTRALKICLSGLSALGAADVLQAFNPRIRETEVHGSPWVWGQPRLHSESMSLKNWQVDPMSPLSVLGSQDTQLSRCPNFLLSVTLCVSFLTPPF